MCEGSGGCGVGDGGGKGDSAAASLVVVVVAVMAFVAVVREPFGCSGSLLVATVAGRAHCRCPRMPPGSGTG